MRLGTRASPLALAQARHVAALLGGDVELVEITTTGDRDRALPDKEKWVKELELALLDGRVDACVHSAKDVPTTLPDGLVLAGVPAREDARDVLCGPALDALPDGARVGTSSLRRAAQLRAVRPDLEIVAVRGNVGTRLGRLADGDVDALVLAAAGLRRLGRPELDAATPLDPARFVPAAGQGVLALECRADDEAARAALAALGDPAAETALTAERAVVRELGADCHSAVGAHATADAGGTLLLRAWVGTPDGGTWVTDAVAAAPEEDPEALGRRVAERLSLVGAQELLAAARSAEAGA